MAFPFSLPSTPKPKPPTKILPSKLFLCLVRPFWSSITFYVPCALQVRIYSSHARPLFTWGHLWHVRTIYLFARLVPLVKTWLDHEEMLYMEDKRQGHSPHFIRDRHGNNYEIMMVMIRVLKPGLVDKQFISIKY